MLKRQLFYINVCCFIITVRSGFFRMMSGLISFNNSTLKLLLDGMFSEISPIQTKLLAILSQISLPWLQWSVVVKFVWHLSIARPRKPPAKRKDPRYLLHTPSYCLFCVNFVAMATLVIRSGYRSIRQLSNSVTRRLADPENYTIGQKIATLRLYLCTTGVMTV